MRTRKKKCELCGVVTMSGINSVPYCIEHLRDGLIREARLEAWRKTGDPDIIERSERFAAHVFDNDPAVRAALEERGFG